jgi:RNA 2',3'-cyclic 3'-phosphodiesterase
VDKRPKRVFIGIPAGEDLIAQVMEFRKRHAGLRVRWTRPDYLHLTVVPPWESQNPGSICGILGETASGFLAADATFTMVTPGPVPSRPRLVWAVGKTVSFFPALRDELSARLPLVPVEHRPFLLHLTIARVRHEDEHDLARMKLEEPVSWTATFRRLCLYESILKPSGAEYRVLCEAPFGQKNDGLQ